MRGAYLYRKRQPSSERTMVSLKPLPAVPAAPSVSLAPTLVEDYNVFFHAMDDECDAGREPGQSMMSSTATDALDSIEEQQGTDVAIAILEDFFFGGKKFRHKRNLLDASRQPQNGYHSQSSTTATCSDHSGACSHEVESSPTSVALHMCSCPADHKSWLTGLPTSKSRTLQESDSVPPDRSRSPSCSPKPIKPTLKSRSTSSSSLCSSNRNVSFTEISVREYDVELSDHPSCSFGPPIQLGWDYEEKEKIPVEDYEGSRSPRREVHELVLSYNARRRLLKQSGYKKKEILAVEKEVDRIKRERLVTAFFLPYSAVDETFERVSVCFKQLFQPKQSCLLHP